MRNGTLRLATRPSKLARWQTDYVAQALSKDWPRLATEQTVMETRGDLWTGQPLPEIGGKGLFTAELDRALLEKRVDLVVHSLKDLPIEEAGDLVIAAIPKRAAAHDVLLSANAEHLDDLPPGARVGTSSLRRQAQVLSRRPDVRVQPIRGNVDTRIRKLLDGEFDAIVLAAAGVLRLGLQEHISEDLPLAHVLPAPGQGALAVQCRREDETTRKYLERLEHPDTRKAVEAERAFLAALGGGCSLPVGAYAQVRGRNIEMMGRVISVDGLQKIDVAGQGRGAKELGNTLAEEALAQGAAELLGV